MAGYRLVRLTAAQQAGVACLACGRMFGAFDTPRRVRHRPGARRCAPVCVLDTVAATAHLFRALVPAAHLRILPASPQPHAAAAAARVLVLVDDRRVITPAIPAASAAAVAAQARRLGLRALIEPGYPFRRSPSDTAAGRRLAPCKAGGADPARSRVGPSATRRERAASRGGGRRHQR